jgi:hypothetical protein
VNGSLESLVGCRPRPVERSVAPLDTSRSGPRRVRVPSAPARLALARHCHHALALSGGRARRNTAGASSRSTPAPARSSGSHAGGRRGRCPRSAGMARMPGQRRVAMTRMPGTRPRGAHALEPPKTKRWRTRGHPGAAQTERASNAHVWRAARSPAPFTCRPLPADTNTQHLTPQPTRQSIRERETFGHAPHWPRHWVAAHVTSRFSRPDVKRDDADARYS